mgnify:CR=1 FL=1
MANKIANRKVICDTLLEAAKTDKDIVVLCSDSRGSASLTPFFDQYPQQSVEVGIAEQDLVSIAARHGFVRQEGLGRLAGVLCDHALV